MEGQADGANLREQYRERAARLDLNEAELTNPSNTLLKDEVEHFNELFKMSRANAHETARNSALDSRCILKASRLGIAQSANLNHATPLEFVRGVKRAFGNLDAAAAEKMTQADLDKIPVTINWTELGALAQSAFFDAAAWDAPWDASLVAVVGKERKKAERRAKDVLEAEVRPQELSATEVNTVTEATQKRRSDAMRAMIEKAERRAGASGAPFAGLNFFHVVLNADERVGFGQTIENLFDFSFHLKEGVVRIDIDEHGEPIVHLARPPSAQSYADGLQRVQNILKLDHPTWQRLCARYGAGACLLPTRKKGCAPPAEGATGSGSGKRAKK